MLSLSPSNFPKPCNALLQRSTAIRTPPCSAVFLSPSCSPSLSSWKFTWKTFLQCWGLGQRKCHPGVECPYHKATLTVYKERRQWVTEAWGWESEQGRLGTPALDPQQLSDRDELTRRCRNHLSPSTRWNEEHTRPRSGVTEGQNCRCAFPQDPWHSSGGTKEWGLPPQLWPEAKRQTLYPDREGFTSLRTQGDKRVNSVLAQGWKQCRLVQKKAPRIRGKKRKETRTENIWKTAAFIQCIH